VSDLTSGGHRRVLVAVATGGLLILAIVILVALLTISTGYDAKSALIALWRGSLGTTYAIFSATLVRSTPLILTGLAVAVAFTAGVVNIGAEGQLLAGATASVGVALGTTSLGRASLVLSLLAGAFAGALWTLIPAWLRRRFGVLEVISTIMMNFIALYLVGYLIRGPLQEPLHIYPQTRAIAQAARLPLLIPGQRLHWGFVVAITCSVALWWMMRSTAIGFRFKVAGQNPDAARVAGLIDVERTAMGAFLISGSLAGIAGAIEITGVTYSLYENLSPGYGYTAIAVALVGSLNPASTALSAILFGALEAGASAMQRDAGIPSVLASVVEASIILIVVAAAGWRSRGISWLTRRPSADRAAKEPGEQGPAS
jgi:simple sugar transport system permease protein